MQTRSHLNALFLLSLLSSATRRMDWLAVGLGITLGPSLYLLAPGPDLMLTGVIGGTLAWWLGRGRP